MWLDIDLGELASEPEHLYACAHLVNVACGGHAGDSASMARAVALAARHGARVGAHPSYPDREGFGRRPLAMSWVDVARSVTAQCEALRTHVAPRHVKMHGALYHAIDRSPEGAAAVLSACRAALGVVEVLGPPGGETARAAAALGMPFLREGFADRGLRPDGTLVPRGEPGALLESPSIAAAQAARLAREGRFEVLCVHGDGAHAAAIAQAVREVLDR